MSLCVVTTYSMDFGCIFSKESFYSGSRIRGRETVKNINANGFMNLDGTTVTDSTSVNGRFRATDADLNKLYVNGSANLEKCTVHGNATINGSLKGKDNTFEDTLTISSHEVCLNSTSTQSIEIRKVTHDNNKQVVMLENNSTVMGDITFASGNGVVVVDSKSKILGNAIGGVVVKKDDYDKDSKNNTIGIFL